MIGEAMPSITDRTDIQIIANRFFTIETIPATIPIKAPAGPIMHPNPPHTITPKTESITSIVRYSFAVGPANNRVPVSAEHINPNPDNASAMIDSTNGASGFFTGREPGMFVCWIDILLSPRFPYPLLNYTILEQILRQVIRLSLLPRSGHIYTKFTALMHDL